VLTAGLMFCFSAAAMSQNISNTREGNGNPRPPRCARKQHPTHDQLDGKQSSCVGRQTWPRPETRTLSDLRRRFPYAWAAKMSTRRSAGFRHRTSDSDSRILHLVFESADVLILVKKEKTLTAIREIGLRIFPRVRKHRNICRLGEGDEA